MGRWSRVLGRAFVDWLGLEPRAHWLDVGCGTGALTAAICELAKPASVIACDPSGPFLEAASSNLPDKRVTFELASAEHLPARNGGFDAIVCGLLLNFLSDPVRALAAMKRKLSPQGLVAAYVWDYAGGVRFLNEFWQAATELAPEAAPLDEARRFAFCNTVSLTDAFRAAGFGEVQVARLSLTTTFASFDEYWEPFLGRTGPAPSYVASLDAEHRERLKQRLRERLEGQQRGAPIELEANAWAVRSAPGAQ
jgi:ubiquinone/menaquinone biosynthesis C-methylase UbiE